jgi:hypothetical protein
MFVKYTGTMTAQTKEKYYYMTVFGTDDNGHHVGGGHVIKSESMDDALRIREKYGISNPMHAKGKLRIRCEELDMKEEHNQQFIERRRKQFTGSIWYEEDNKLKKETE